MKLPRLALVALVASFGAPVEAVTLATAQLGVNPNFSGGTGPVNTVLSDPVSAELSSGAVTGGFSSSGSAHAYADIGTIKLEGASQGSLNSVARGIFRDDIKIDLPGVSSGTAVQIAFTINLDGTLSVNDHHDANAGWQVRADVGGGAFDLAAEGQLYNNSPAFAKHGYFGDAMGPLHGMATVTTGFWAPLYVELTASAQTAYNGSGGTTLASSSFDFAHTLTWGGMTVSLGGVQQSGALVTSGSGLNYLQAVAVPEPAPAALLGAGLAFLLWRRRFRA